MILLVFVATLVALSAVGLVERSSSSNARALAPCTEAASAAISFQSAVTNDLRNHTRLHSDTRRFARELHKLDASACPDTAPFLGTAEQTLGALCKDCVRELRGSRAAAVTG